MPSDSAEIGEGTGASVAGATATSRSAPALCVNDSVGGEDTDGGATGSSACLDDELDMPSDGADICEESGRGVASAATVGVAEVSGGGASSRDRQRRGTKPSRKLNMESSSGGGEEGMRWVRWWREERWI